MESTADIINYAILERDLMLKYHGSKVLLLCEGTWLVKDTMPLFFGKINPVTKLALTDDEMIYAAVRHQCYVAKMNGKIIHLGSTSDITRDADKGEYDGYTETDVQSLSVLYQNIKRVRYPLHGVPKNTWSRIRGYLTITDFQEHYKDFDLVTGRMKARSLLAGARVGTWLLRPSSYNAREELVALTHDKLVNYYSLDFVSKKSTIEHLLLIHIVGLGWSYCKLKFPCFIDCLESAADRYGLSFDDTEETYLSV